ncbi:MAG: amidohydrolase family protein [Pirellulales bacterium]
MQRLKLLGAFALALFAARSALAGPEIPGAPQAKPVALVGGTIYPVSGPAIERGTLLFDSGKITALGVDAAVPEGAERIDAAGKHIYPGLIESNSDLGLVEIDAVRATRDQAETGAINPNVKAQIAFNPDSEQIPVTRANGILLAAAVPSGGLLAGQSALMRLDGWTWEDMTQKSPLGLHIHWPAMTPAYNWRTADSAKDQLEARDRQLAELQQAFDDARAYHKAKDAAAADGRPTPPADVRWEAMRPVLDGALPIIVSADELAQILAAADFARREKLKLIIYGGYDAAECADVLKQLDAAVILAGVHRLPSRRHDAYDDPFTLPARLKSAGVKFCISSGDRRASMVRNLPNHAATAAAHGLSPEDALRSITLWPAEILGVAEQVGSLAVGKEATLIVTDGDILEIPTQIEQAYVQGRTVDLDSRHKRLWRKYQEKYHRLPAPAAGKPTGP